MTSTFTTNKALEEPANGDYVNDWNVPVNANFSAIDAALGGVTTLNVTGISGNVVLTSTQYRPSYLYISGTLTANVVYQLPAGVGGTWVVNNQTSGSYTVSLQSGTSGGLVAAPQGGTTILTSDGSNVFSSMTSGYTPTQLDSSQRLATTSYVRGALGNLSASTVITSAPYTIPSAGFGGVYQVQSGGAGGTITFPSVTTSAQTITIYNNSGSNITLSSGNFNSAYGNGSSITFPTAATGVFYSDGTSWNAIGGSAAIGSGKSAGGSNTQVQYNSGGSLAGSGNLTFNGTTLSANSITISNPLPVASGGTGVTSSTGSGSVVLNNAPTFLNINLQAGDGSASYAFIYTDIASGSVPNDIVFRTGPSSSYRYTRVDQYGNLYVNSGSGTVYGNLAVWSTQAWTATGNGFNTTYTNTNSYPIQVALGGYMPTEGGGAASATVNGVQVAYCGSNTTANDFFSFSFIVPPGGTYIVSVSNTVYLGFWSEYR